MWRLGSLREEYRGEGNDTVREGGGEESDASVSTRRSRRKESVAEDSQASNSYLPHYERYILHPILCQPPLPSQERIYTGLLLLRLNDHRRELQNPVRKVLVFLARQGKSDLEQDVAGSAVR